MEEINKIIKFISSNDSGSGDGYGSGYGSGYDFDYGDEFGLDSGSGEGSGYGSASGFGYGSGYDSGLGTGSGSGSGSGSASGYGIGSGSGDGYGNSYSIKIKKFNSDVVFYVDGVPTIFDHIKGDFAKGRIINTNHFTTTECFVAKQMGYFAHEKTLKKAVETARNKYFSNLNIDEKLTQFKHIFKIDKKYPATEFYKWHNILTGSCQQGRDYFIKSHNIDMSKELSVVDFINLCENEYGGEIIKKLKNYYIGVK